MVGNSLGESAREGLGISAVRAEKTGNGERRRERRLRGADTKEERKPIGWCTRDRSRRRRARPGRSPDRGWYAVARSIRPASAMFPSPRRRNLCLPPPSRATLCVLRQWAFASRSLRNISFRCSGPSSTASCRNPGRMSTRLQRPRARARPLFPSLTWYRRCR